MKPKTITIVSLIIAVVGILIALFGTFMDARYDGHGSGTVLMWVGVAITFVFALGGMLLAASQAKKSNDK